MILASGDKNGREFLLIGLSRGNLKLLQQDRPIVIAPETHPGCPKEFEIVIMYGETEAAMAVRLKALGVLEGADIIAVPKPSDKTQ